MPNAKKTKPAKPAAKEKAPRYRELTEEEQDMLFAIFDKHGGNVSAMVLDKECPFFSWNQLAHYRDRYDFRKKMAKIRGQRAKEVMANLHDSKILALQHARRLLEPRFQIVVTKTGAQLFDEGGVPVMIETLPYYKELKVAWEIIKAELGEPTENLGVKGARDMVKKLHAILDEDEDVSDDKKTKKSAPTDS